MKTALFAIQIVLSVLLMISVLSQQRSAGLSETFGGGSSFFTTKRGAEKVLSIATVVIVVLFVANSIAFLFVK